jgi:hypothetical protein
VHYKCQMNDPRDAIYVLLLKKIGANESCLFFPHNHTGSGAHPASYLMGTRGSFPGG